MNHEQQSLSPEAAENERLQKSAEHYRNLFDSYQSGPQKEGLSAQEVIESLQDPDTVSIQIESDEGETVEVPLFVPLRYNEWLSDRFFEKTFGEDREVMYMSNIPGLYEDEAALNQLSKAIDQLEPRNPIVVTEHFDEEFDPMPKIQSIADMLGIEHEHYSLTDSDELAGEWHYAGPVDSFKETGKESMSLIDAYTQGVKEGRYPRIETNSTGTKITDSIEDRDAIDRLWKLYEGPFHKLAETNPVRASFTYEEFVDAMQDKNVIKSIYQEDGEVITFCFLQNDLDLCPWINQEYYKSKFPEEYESGQILYFPGIVTDEEKRGGTYSGRVIDMITSITYDSGQEPVIIFECNDVSRHYIPKIVERVVNGSNKVQTEVQGVGAHLYQAIELGDI